LLAPALNPATDTVCVSAKSASVNATVPLLESCAPGTGVGWLLIRGWRRPFRVIPTGVVVWVCTVVAGMLLRKATSAGVATSFVVVASVSTAVLLMGWRGVAALVGRG